jgi:hypothetical protein
LFAAGIAHHDRAFGKLRAQYLPHKSMADVVSYYYNIWKIRCLRVCGEGG